MDISVSGQNLLSKIILSRITTENIDRISSILSSNVCENYFSMLSKFTNGKRKNVDFSDLWRVQQAMVCGLKSNANFTSDILEKMGVLNSIIRENYMKQKNSEKVFQQHYHKSDKQIERRKMATQVRNHLLNKNQNNSGRHQTDKVKPTETSDKSKKRPRKESKCGNCGRIGHTRTKCVEPDSRNIASEENDKAVNNIINLFK